MKIPRRIILCLAAALSCFVLLPAASVQATTYYVAKEDGSDSWDGLAATWDGTHGPWSSLEHAGNRVYDAGSTILLKRGKVWNNGNAFIVNGYGSSSSPNTISAYGSGPNPIIQGTNDTQGGTYGIYIATPDYWTIDGVDFKDEWRAIEVPLSTTDHTNFTVQNCNFSTYNAYAQHVDGVWPTPAATGINVEGSNLAGGTALSGLSINNCRFTMMGMSVGVNNYQHNGNNALVTNVTISNCIMTDGSFLQLVAVGATNFTVQHTKIWNNGTTIDEGPANFAFYAVPGIQTNLLVEDCEIGFDRRDNSPRDGDGVELQNINGGPSHGNGATFRRVLFHHNEAVAIVVNADCQDVTFDSCVFAADESNDLSTACERYGEIRLHANLASTFTSCRFLPRNGLPDIPARSGWEGSTCAAEWHGDITYSNTTTSAYGSEVLGANLAAGAASYQYTDSGSGYPTWEYSFGATTVNTVVLSEIPGAAIGRFVVQYWDGAAWKDAYTGATLGTSTYDTYLPFPSRNTTGIRVQRIDGGSTLGLSDFQVYNVTGSNPTDQFLSTTLDSTWNWVRPYNGWNLYDRLGFLRVATDGNDLWQTGAPAPNSIVLRSCPAGDWTATTRLEFSANQNYQQAGIIFYGDANGDDNYVKLDFGYDSWVGGMAVEFASEVGGAYAALSKTAVNTTAIFLRVVKSGTTYYGYYSLDGSNWSYLGTRSNGIGSGRIGLIAQSTTGAFADFDWFDVR